VNERDIEHLKQMTTSKDSKVDTIVGTLGLVHTWVS
jgi:hypothetical protein